METKKKSAGWISTASSPPGFRLTHGECLLFGAVMSPSDSVTVCTLLNPKLYPSMFGALSGEGKTKKINNHNKKF